MTNLAFQKRKSRCSYDVRKNNLSKLKIVSIFKSNKNIYLYLSNPDGMHIFSVSTLSKLAPEAIARHKNTNSASWLGLQMAEKLKTMGIDRVVFDRSGYKFQGKAKEIVNSMTNGGIKCS